jgi:hypothetical protein
MMIDDSARTLLHTLRGTQYLVWSCREGEDGPKMRGTRGVARSLSRCSSIRVALKIEHLSAVHRREALVRLFSRRK